MSHFAFQLPVCLLTHFFYVFSLFLALSVCVCSSASFLSFFFSLSLSLFLISFLLSVFLTFASFSLYLSFIVSVSYFIVSSSLYTYIYIRSQFLSSLLSLSYHSISLSIYPSIVSFILSHYLKYQSNFLIACLLPPSLFLSLSQAWAIQMTVTLDGKVILVPPNSQNFILSSFSYCSMERFFIYFPKYLLMRITVR